MANETEVRIAEDNKSNNMQFGHLNTAKFLSLIGTTPVQFSTESKQFVCITGAQNAFIQIRKTATAPAANTGFQYLAGTYYHTIIQKDEWISTTAPIHICALGESIEG